MVESKTTKAAAKPRKKAEDKASAATAPAAATAVTHKEAKVKLAKAPEGKASACKQNLHISARKLRLLANLARGKDVQHAIEVVRYSNKKLASEVIKLIRSAVNNASQVRGVNVDRLFVKRIMVDQGPTLKRFMTRARGSGARILKRMAHMTVVVDERI
jgi:large subunit ribosomal protein L22